MSWTPFIVVIVVEWYGSGGLPMLVVSRVKKTKGKETYRELEMRLLPALPYSWWCTCHWHISPLWVAKVVEVEIGRDG